VSSKRDLTNVLLVKLAVGLLVLAVGFRAISDDDFARVVLAQRFAIDPRIDPTGTSWLPFPFWLTGGVMALCGRSLVVARWLAFALGLLSAAGLYGAARVLRVDRQGAVAGAVLGSILPYSALLGVATVPELPTAALCVFAVATLARPSAELRLLGAVALLAATLSRYEPWVIAGGFAAASALDVVRGDLGANVGAEPKARSARASAIGLGAVAVALLGPVGWLLHNRLSHGDALHFLARVSAYKQAISGAGAPGSAALEAALAVPLALVQKEPELGMAGGLLAVYLAFTQPSAFCRVGHKRALTLGLLLVVGLALAAARGGAPTHHEGRALLVVWLLGAIFVGAQGCAAFRRSSQLGRAILVGASAAIVVLGSTILRPWYGHIGQFGHRDAAVAIGQAAGELVPPGELVLIELRDYGYFAVQAASGRPEAFVLDRDIDPRLQAEPSSFASADSLRARARQARTRFAIGYASEAAGPLAPLGAPLAQAGPWALWQLVP